MSYSCGHLQRPELLFTQGSYFPQAFRPGLISQLNPCCFAFLGTSSQRCSVDSSLSKSVEHSFTRTSPLQFQTSQSSVNLHLFGEIISTVGQKCSLKRPRPLGGHSPSKCVGKFMGSELSFLSQPCPIWKRIIAPCRSFV